MKRYDQLVADALREVGEVLPWDLAEEVAAGSGVLLVDVREPREFAQCAIRGAINVPRGILEQSCEYGYEETVPELAAARGREVVTICRSGKRSALAARTLKEMGYTQVRSLRTGIKGWNDAEHPLVDADGLELDDDAVEEMLVAKLRPGQEGP